ncbi:zinc ribbon domain-containing protein [Paenibacillus sophorae]|uniref:Zinc ribbon domain-containing protein n=2 Tax=Paenibacillus sophorae TaxID=1333845 RepID=A0ABX8HFC1_9BACL|nr:zinc ribbon domain-containing protein [Paenibacillus sophorae]QWU16856.1 zinc ribbon domain-containing protein [Paenibacillus sophorae]
MEHHMEHNGPFCQSCGMPVAEKDLLGTDREGIKTEEYCKYCYEDGEFKQPDITLQGMIDLCAGYLVQQGMDEAEAKGMLAQTLPLLKRWREESVS